MFCHFLSIVFGYCAVCPSIYGIVLPLKHLQILLIPPSYKEGMIGILFISLSSPHVCTCPEQELGFPTLFVVVLFVFSEIK
jgi:hypothetical protein